MMPAPSTPRPRSSEARGDKPTACASFWMVERPSRWSAARILTSMRSSAGGRLAALLVQRCVLHRHRVIQNEPAAVGINGLPGNVARVVRRQEDRDGGDLVGLADAPERRARQDRALGVA